MKIWQKQRNDKQVKSNKLDLNNDILNKKWMFQRSYLYKYYWWRSWISKTLDKYSIIEIISKYNKELASEINKWEFVKLNIQKQEKAIGISIKPLTEAYDSDKKI